MVSSLLWQLKIPSLTRTKWVTDVTIETLVEATADKAAKVQVQERPTARKLRHKTEDPFLPSAGLRHFI